MIELTASYGHGCFYGVWLSFRALDDFQPEGFIGVAMGFGCHESFAEKASSLLSLSGRYDCMAQQGWVNRQFGELKVRMGMIGVQIVTDAEYFPPCIKR